jgi:hypothetical protein
MSGIFTDVAAVVVGARGMGAIPRFFELDVPDPWMFFFFFFFFFVALLLLLLLLFPMVFCCIIHGLLMNYDILKLVFILYIAHVPAGDSKERSEYDQLGRCNRDDQRMPSGFASHTAFLFPSD